MGIGFRATGIATGVLLALLLMEPTAKADSFHVTGQTDWALCTSRGVTCFAASYRLDITTDSLRISPPVRLLKTYDVVAIFGEIDGHPVSGGSGQLIISELGLPDWPAVPWSNVYMFESGFLQSFLGGPESSGGLSDVLIQYDPQGNFVNNLATWNAVSTPEPSTLLSLSIGLLGLVGLVLHKRFS